MVKFTEEYVYIILEKMKPILGIFLNVICSIQYLTTLQSEHWKLHYEYYMKIKGQYFCSNWFLHYDLCIYNLVKIPIFGATLEEPLFQKK